MSPEERRERIRKRINLMRTLRLTEELDLDEEKAMRLFSRLRPIDKLRSMLFRDRLSLNQELRQASRFDIIDAARLEKIISGLRKNRSAMLSLEEEEMKALDGFLTPRQKAKILLFRERFQEEIKARISTARKRKMDGPVLPLAPPGR